MSYQRFNRNKEHRDRRKQVDQVAGYPVEQAIKGVLRWADDNPNFDASFVESLSENFEQWGKLTSRQIDSLENIITSWNIDLGEYA